MNCSDILGFYNINEDVNIFIFYMIIHANNGSCFYLFLNLKTANPIPPNTSIIPITIKSHPHQGIPEEETVVYDIYTIKSFFVNALAGTTTTYKLLKVFFELTFIPKLEFTST